MAKQSKIILLAYNKCAALATKFQNILDSFWHKDEKIPASAIEGLENVDVSGKLDKGNYAGNAADLKASSDKNADDIQSNTEAIANTVNLTENQTIEVEKTFLYDKLGIRNFANTFTSYFRNLNTATRYYTFQNRNGIIADDTDLAGKQDKYESPANKIPKSNGDGSLLPSRIEDNGNKIGIDTIYSPTKDITLGNQTNKVIGVEESDANTRGKDLTIEAGRTNDYRVSANFNALNTGMNFISIASKSNGDLYAIDIIGRVYKRDFNTTNFVLQTIPVNDIIKVGVTHDDRLFFLSLQNSQTLDGMYLEDSVNSNTYTLQYPSYLIRGGTVAPNGDIYTCSAQGFTADIYQQVAGTSVRLEIPSAIGLTWESISSAPNGDIYAVRSNGSNGDIYKRTGGTGDFIPYNDFKEWQSVHVARTGDVYASTVNGDLYVQFNDTNVFIPLNQEIATWGEIASDANNNLYSIRGLNHSGGRAEGDIYFRSSSNKGAENLNGGTLKHIAGTGKGEGKSRIEFYTGQKLASGTDMQPETLRGYIDENGWFVYNYPIYPDNASAVGAGLPNNAVYKDNNGNLKSVTI